MEIKIRDLRRKDQYKIDDAYLNGYARICGVYATAVYNSLSRHADFHTQECFPSIETIAEQHNISKPTVIKAVAELQKWGIISVAKEKDEKTKRQKNNVYILADKTEWKDKPSKGDLLGAESTAEQEPSKSHDKSRVNHVDCKDTQIKDTQIKVLAPTSGADDVSQENKQKKGLDDDTPMDLQEFVKWCRESPQRHINLIAEYADTKKLAHKTKGQWRSFISRNVRPARLLEPFTDDQIGDAMGRLERDKKGNGGFISRWTLETLVKYLEK